MAGWGREGERKREERRGGRMKGGRKGGRDRGLGKQKDVIFFHKK